MPNGGWNFIPPEGMSVDDPRYFQEYKAQRDAYFNEPEESEDEPAESIELLEPARLVPATELGTKARATMKAALELGWDVRAWRSRTRVAPVLFLSETDERASSQHKIGDVRFAGYDARHYCVEARHPRGPLGFQAHWMGKGAGTSAAFLFARVRDPIGIPVENWVDFKPIRVLRGKDETASSFERRVESSQQDAARRIVEYNDGGRVAHIYQYKKSTDFDLWLGDYTSRSNEKEQAA